jgi:hypothetical protein
MIRGRYTIIKEGKYTIQGPMGRYTIIKEGKYTIQGPNS